MINKVLVTGGLGFIGARITDRLISKGINVVILEHPNSIIPEKYSSIEVIKADIVEKEKIQKLKINNIDAVLHLAAQSSGPRSFHMPMTDVELNIIGTLNIIQFCINNNVERLLLLHLLLFMETTLRLKFYTKIFIVNQNQFMQHQS